MFNFCAASHSQPQQQNFDAAPQQQQFTKDEIRNKRKEILSFFSTPFESVMDNQFFISAFNSMKDTERINEVINDYLM